jgi:hypothetical protein
MPTPDMPPVTECPPDTHAPKSQVPFLCNGLVEIWGRAVWAKTGAVHNSSAKAAAFIRGLALLGRSTKDCNRQLYSGKQKSRLKRRPQAMQISDVA